jgi:hypothetical protein
MAQYNTDETEIDWKSCIYLSVQWQKITSNILQAYKSTGASLVKCKHHHSYDCVYNLSFDSNPINTTWTFYKHFLIHWSLPTG